MGYLFDVIAFVNEDEVNPNFRPSEAGDPTPRQRPQVAELGGQDYPPNR